MSLMVLADFVEWQERAVSNKSTTTATTNNSKDSKQKKDKKDKSNKKVTRGNKVTLDFDSDGDKKKSLLNCFFGDDKASDEFRIHHFQQHPVVSRKHDISEVKQALFNLNIGKLLSNTSSDQIHVWMKSVESEALNSITVSDAEQAQLLYQAGHSLYCRAPPHFEQIVVPQLTKELSYGIDIANNDRFRRGEVEMFYSRKGHYTDFHTDFQENFTIQLSGTKKWIFADSTASHPIRGCTPHFNQTKDKDLVEQQMKILKLGECTFSPEQFKDNPDEHTEIILQPGDIMYHPAGIWHRVECLDDSISLNISMTGVSFADVFCCSLQQLLMENPLWRSSVFHEDSTLSNNGKPSAEQIMKSIIESVPKLVQSLNPADLLPFPTMRNKPSRDESKNLLVQVSGDSNNQQAGGGNEEGDNDSDDDEEEEENEGGSDEEDMEMESMEGSDLDDLIEEFENENDEEEYSGSASNQLIVNIRNIDIEHCGKYFHAISDDNVEDGKSSKKRKAPSSSAISCSFRFNPCAMVLEHEDGEKYKLIVHCGYGNETLESAARAELLVPVVMKSFVKTLLSFYEYERNKRIKYFLRINQKVGSFSSNNNTDEDRYPYSIYNFRDMQSYNSKEKLSDEDLMRVVFGLKIVGAVTFL